MTSGREANQELRSIVGQRLPFATAPALTRLREKLTDEFPHLVSQLDALLSGLVEGEPLRMRPTLLVGAPGGGKSRLARRFSERACCAVAMPLVMQELAFLAASKYNPLNGNSPIVGLFNNGL